LPDLFQNRRASRCQEADLRIFRVMSPLAKRIVFSWIATDFIWGALLVYVLKREQG
jgi:hypothetical protein